MPAPRESEKAGTDIAGELGQYCAIEEWTGSLESGLFRLGATTRQILGIGGIGGCGLLTLIQTFDPADRCRLIDLFERAAGEPMRFSFTTVIAGHGKAGQSVYCIGRSDGHDTHRRGTFSGVFIFPHL